MPFDTSRFFKFVLVSPAHGSSGRHPACCDRTAMEQPSASIFRRSDRDSSEHRYLRQTHVGIDCVTWFSVCVVPLYLPRMVTVIAVVVCTAHKLPRALRLVSEPNTCLRVCEIDFLLQQRACASPPARRGKARRLVCARIKVLEVAPPRPRGDLTGQRGGPR